MNGMILQTAPENKDIKFSTEKDVDTKSEESGNIFEDLIAKLVSQEEESENSSFLLGKLLNLSSDFTNKGKIISEFSKGDILKEEKGEEILVEDLFKLALNLKNNLPIEKGDNLPKDLKIALKDKDIIAEFKSAKNIKELLSVANKHDIKVKNFQFFMSESALNPKDKKMVQKITSEDIFKMIEPKSISQEKQSTQSILTKIITQEAEKKNSHKTEKSTTLTSLLSKENREIQKETNVGKDPIISSKVEKKIEKTIDNRSQNDEISTDLEGENFQIKKPQKAAQNRLASLLNNETQNKDIKTPIQTTSKEEPLTKTESDSKETLTDKHTPTHEVKTETIHKNRETPDIKKTFNTFATEFKEKVEAYKPPLMKINMQLSPKNLGDVDVTLLTRGNNLHVNINTNSSNTLALFVQNQAEFKNSLVNMGFSDLQMNFGDSRGEQRGQNHNKDTKEQADYYDSLENEENNGIEMIIPHYV